MKRTISFFLIATLLLSFTSFGTVLAEEPTVRAEMTWDDPDTGRLTVTGSFSADYAGRKVILFVTDPAVDLNDASIADSEKYFGIRQGFVNEDGSYRFENRFYARPGTYQVNVIADTMTAPVTAPLTVTGTYYDFTVTSNAGGTVAPSGAGKVLRNDSVQVKITCGEGYRIQSITKNASPLPILEEFVIDTVTENIALDVVFEKIPDEKPNFTKHFISYIPAAKDRSVTFGSIAAGSGWEILDYGVVYSETKPEPTLEDTENCIPLPHKVPMNTKGQYGIQLQGAYLIGKLYYTRPYITCKKGNETATVYGETVVTNLQ